MSGVCRCVGNRLPIPRHKFRGWKRGLNARAWQHSPLVVLCLGPADASEHNESQGRKFLMRCVVLLAHYCEYLGPCLVRSVGSPHCCPIPFPIPASTVRSPLSPILETEASPCALGRCARGHWLKSGWFRYMHDTFFYTCRHVEEEKAGRTFQHTSLRNGMFPQGRHSDLALKSKTGIPTLLWGQDR